MGDVVQGLRDAAAAVSAQAAAQAGGTATPGHRRGLSCGAASDARTAAEAEAVWRAGGDGAKWLECLDDTDVAGKRLCTVHLPIPFAAACLLQVPGFAAR